MAIVHRKNKDGSSTYQVKVIGHDRKWLPSASFANLNEAKAHEVELLKQRTRNQGISVAGRKYTVQDYWEVWSVDNRTETSAGWKLSQDQMYRDYILPIIGGLILGEVTPPDIGKVLNRMVTLGRSSQMRKHVYSLLRQMFSDAVEYYEMISYNPVRSKHHKPKVVRKKRSFLAPIEGVKLLQIARSHPYLGPPVWLKLLAGLRDEAVQALCWGAVMWEQDQILICKAYKRKVRKMENFPKGKDWEYVPMPPALKEYLWALWLASPQKPSDYVCRGPRGGMLSHDTYWQALRKLCRENGLTEVTPHELRHSCTELYVHMGASREDLRRLLNHKSGSTTEGYIHRTESRLAAIAGSLSTPQLAVIEGGKQECFPNSFPHGKQSTYAGHGDSDRKAN